MPAVAQPSAWAAETPSRPISANASTSVSQDPAVAPAGREGRGEGRDQRVEVLAQPACPGRQLREERVSSAIAGVGRSSSCSNSTRLGSPPGRSPSSAARSTRRVHASQVPGLTGCDTIGQRQRIQQAVAHADVEEPGLRVHFDAQLVQHQRGLVDAAQRCERLRIVGQHDLAGRGDACTGSLRRPARAGIVLAGDGHPQAQRQQILRPSPAPRPPKLATFSMITALPWVSCR